MKQNCHKDEGHFNGFLRSPTKVLEDSSHSKVSAFPSFPLVSHCGAHEEENWFLKSERTRFLSYHSEIMWPEPTV